MIGTLCLLLSVLVFTTSPSGGEGSELPEEPADGRAAKTLVARLPETHLVVLFDPGSAHTADFRRECDAGMDHVVSVEVVVATDTMLLGLEEALATSADCSTGDCPQLAVLDLRSALAR